MHAFFAVTINTYFFIASGLPLKVKVLMIRALSWQYYVAIFITIVKRSYNGRHIKCI